MSRWPRGCVLYGQRPEKVSSLLCLLAKVNWWREEQHLDVGVSGPYLSDKDDTFYTLLVS